MAVEEIMEGGAPASSSNTSIKRREGSKTKRTLTERDPKKNKERGELPSRSSRNKKEEFGCREKKENVRGGGRTTRVLPSHNQKGSSE